MNLFNALIIDDEPAARRILRHLLEPHGWIQLKGEAARGEEALQKIQELDPDLIFLDIQLPDISGFDVLERISRHPYIIFTTAYEQYALRAFESFSIDYLLKPIREERMVKALQKLQQFGKGGFLPTPEQIRMLAKEMAPPSVPQAFPLRQGDRILLFPFDQLAYFEAEDKYIFLHTLEGKKYLTDHTLSDLETRLPAQFLRVQKSYIINKEKVGELQRHFNGRFLIVLNDKLGTRILTGQTYYEILKRAFHL